MTRTNLSKDRLRVWLKLLKASGQIEHIIRARFRDDHETTLPRFDVLAALSRAPEGLKMSEISTQLRVSNGNVTGIVDRLVANGLAHQFSKPGDRRANLVKLTEEGQRVFEHLASTHEVWISDLLSGLANGELEHLSQLLDQTNESIENAQD